MSNPIYRWGYRITWACVMMGMVIICGYSIAKAQAPQDAQSLEVYEPATENGFPVGARASGMGGAQIAAGDDGSALYYNPALLTRIRNIEISGTLTQQRFTNKTSIDRVASPEGQQNNTGLGSLWAIFPVPTERGGLSLGIGLNRVRSFDRIFRYQSFSTIPEDSFGGGEDESGSLWEYSFGGAIEVSPKSSVGISLDIYDGHDDYAAFFDSSFAGGTYNYRHNINDSYTGISGKIGATYAASNWLNLGAVVRFPTSLSIDQSTYTLDGQNEDTGKGGYRYVLPFSFGFGSAINIRDLQVAADISYLDYTQLSYKRGLPDIADADRLVRRYYRDALSYHLGAEYFVRSANLNLRAGYYAEPIPFKGYPVIEQPKYFTVGAGLLIENSATLDLAYVNGSWKREDPSIGSSERYNAQRVLATLSFRIM